LTFKANPTTDNHTLSLHDALPIFKTGAQECDRTFQLMRSVSRVPCRSFQFFTSRGERGFDAFSLFPIFFRIQRQLLNRHCEPGCDEAACYEPAEQKQHARAANLPA